MGSTLDAAQIALNALVGPESFSEDDRVVCLQLLYAGINEAARRAPDAKWLCHSTERCEIGPEAAELWHARNALA